MESCGGTAQPATLSPPAVSGQLYKQSQFRSAWLVSGGLLCKTNPIWRASRPAEYPVFHYSIIPPFHSSPALIMQNEANFWLSGWDRRAKRAKRTQFEEV
jgi:hypothetical protein